MLNGVPFTFAAWIAPGPQQVGLSVIPTPSHVTPAPPRVIPAKAGISCCAIGRTAWRVAVPSRHAARVNGKMGLSILQVSLWTRVARRPLDTAFTGMTWEGAGMTPCEFTVWRQPAAIR